MEIDRKTLKALSADTRIDILKSLTKRRKTPSELSKELGLATPTITEHLERLAEAGLVRREETGHKWIYYDLTEKGESLVKPKVPMQFVLVLGITLMLISAGFLYTAYYGNNLSTTAPSAAKNFDRSSGLGQVQTTSAEIANQTNSTNMTNITEIAHK
jgi:DNA-binding transcriptional ArsR family regulator